MKKIWIFDENHRVYNKDENGKSIGSPIYAWHWVPVEVSGETKQSWILKYGVWIHGKTITKVPKSKPVSWALFSAQDVIKDIWIKENHRRIAKQILDMHLVEHYDVLQKIDNLLGN